MAGQEKLNEHVTSKIMENDFDILNEMTSLNNELVNTQRTLVKQNSEITKLNAKLNAVNTDLEHFIYVVSHDLKEPLRMVISFMDLLKKKYGGALDEKANSYIDFAADGSKRMRKMIEALLQLSKTGNKNAIKELTDVNDLLKDVRDNLLVLFEETGAELIIKTEMPLLVVNRTEINRLFQNLLANAVKFRKKDVTPVIIVDAEELENEWQFSIKDNGIGIEKEKHTRIFEIFARLNPQEAYEGNGIGLAVCKKITEQHGGTIWVNSEVGKGSTFYFTISK